MIYQIPAQTWDAKTCEAKARCTKRDGMGTPYPFKGYIGASSSFGEIRYNGGCTRDGEWYEGEHRPLPILAEGYEIVYVQSWGYRIKRKEQC